MMRWAKREKMMMRNTLVVNSWLGDNNVRSKDHEAERLMNWGDQKKKGWTSTGR